MNKTIKVKKEFTFGELMEYIIQNDVSGMFESIDGKQFEVDEYGEFIFGAFSYGYGETYEVEVEEKITEVTVFENLIWFDLEGNIHISRESSIARIVTFNNLCKKIYIYHNDEFSKVWERE